MAIGETQHTDEIDIVGNLNTKEQIITFINELNGLFTTKEIQIFDSLTKVVFRIKIREINGFVLELGS
ncbi:unnamed protein product [Rotaria sp. Silwood1]|nr:unnamed protein product [Rotaria sp. Silwood1]CAF3648635.1 unnamed protein product [Rotaria sp. Silwood1]CAF3678238.1 unnamed protein product [Rotaria sp. Silwood1]